MSDCVRDVMTSHPVVLRQSASVLDAARAMADANIGPVLVVDRDDTLRGVVTDRDIVVRTVATARGLDSTTLGEMCTKDAVTVSSSDPVGEAIRLMREHAVRRLPVVECGKPVGIVSLGDLALQTESEVVSEVGAALADISAAPSDDPPTETNPKVRDALSRDPVIPKMPAGRVLVERSRRSRPKDH